jgi:hypothetical protein
MPRILPNFLIVGAAKSGTSSLWHYLRAHPDVFVPSQKEIYFFDRDPVFKRGIDWYASLFAEAGSKKAVGEATPSYIASPAAPERMASIVPNARLVAILRNPIDRAYSHYLHTRYYAWERASFAEAVARERSAPEGSEWPYYLLFSRYLPQLERLAKHFPREQILVLLLDDLQRDPVQAFKTLCGHLGIDESVIPPNVGEVTNAYRETRLKALTGLIFRPRVWTRIPKKMRPTIARLLTREGREHKPMDPKTRAELADYFAADNAALADWLGRDLSMWR